MESNDAGSPDPRDTRIKNIIIIAAISGIIIGTILIVFALLAVSPIGNPPTP